MGRRIWTKEEKLNVIAEAKQNGVEVTIRKFGIYPSTYYDWLDKVKSGGTAGLDRAKKTSKDREYIEQLESENVTLKRLLGERELENALKDELLKKAYPSAKRKN
jgi:putative transposase